MKAITEAEATDLVVAFFSAYGVALGSRSRYEMRHIAEGWSTPSRCDNCGTDIPKKTPLYARGGVISATEPNIVCVDCHQALAVFAKLEAA